MAATRLWASPTHVLDLVADCLAEAWERAYHRADRCGCHACQRSFADLSAWLFDHPTESLPATHATAPQPVQG